jgi:DNA-binding IclR family transcriptional regulator
MRTKRRLLTARAAEKTLELLEILVVAGERLTIGRLAAQLGVSRREALLLLVTLEGREVVRWDDQAKVYRPGQKAAEVARQLLGLFGLSSADGKAAVPTRAQSARPVVTLKVKQDRRPEAGGRVARAS